jgi:hypothetical protein
MVAVLQSSWQRKRARNDRLKVSGAPAVMTDDPRMLIQAQGARFCRQEFQILGI